MTRVLSSYSRELRLMKRSPVGTMGSLLVAAVCAVVVTGFFIEKTFPGGFQDWLSESCRYLYWHVFRHAGTRPLASREAVAFAQFQAQWRTHQDANQHYLWVAVCVSGLTLFLWAWLRSSWARRSKISEQVRSGEQTLVTPAELSRLIKAAVKDEKRPHRFREHDLVLGRQKIRICNETIGLHLGIVGASQTGKTNAINQLLCSRRAAREKVLIVDPGGEFYARFGQKDDVILSLHDARGAKWDFWSEGVSEEEMAKALVEVREGMDASSKFFQTTGRAVLTSLFKIASKDAEPLRELWRLANLSAEQLQLVLRQHHEISHRYLGQGDSGQASGVIATSLMNFEFLKYLNHHAREREKQTSAPEKPFSLRRWVLEETSRNWVYLVATDSHWEQTRPLLRLWFDIASTAILEREFGGKEPLVPLWLVCDEVSTVGLLPSLPKVLDRGYKYSGRLVLGLQSLAQLTQIYGPDATANIMQGLQNILIFAANESKLAKEFSERLGRSEVEEYESSFTPATPKGPEQLSISTRQRKRESVTEDEIRSLRENEGYLKLARFPPTKVDFAYQKFPDIHDRSSRWSAKPTFTWLDQDSPPVEAEAGPETEASRVHKPRSMWGL